MSKPTLVLASGSPRRRALLADAGFTFDVDAADIDESAREDEDALAATTRLAREKAMAVAERTAAGRVVLGADTTVVCDGTMLGKPVDEADARGMLARLSGRNHRVLTAWFALRVDGPAPGPAAFGLTWSVVRMREISRAEAAAYVAGGEPMDKAGAYAVQGAGRALVGAVVGSLDNVIGLPVAQVARGLAALGVRPAES